MAALLPTRWRNQRPQERGRPRPHQSDDRSYDPFRSRKSYDRTYTGWVRRRIAALPQSLGKTQRRSGARPSPAASTRRPIVHLFRSRTSASRAFTRTSSPPAWYESGLRPYNHRHGSGFPEQIWCEIQCSQCVVLNIRLRVRIHSSPVARPATRAPTARSHTSVGRSPTKGAHIIFHHPRAESPPYYIPFRIFRVISRLKPTWGVAQARESHRLTRPRHPKLHYGAITGPGWYESGLRPSSTRADRQR